MGFKGVVNRMAMCAFNTSNTISKKGVQRIGVVAFFLNIDWNTMTIIQNKTAKRLTLTLGGLLCLALAPHAHAQVGSCSVEQNAQATSASSNDLNLQCNLTLSKKAQLTRRVIIEGAQNSGLTLDCQGGKITAPAGQNYALLIRSKNTDNTWSAPTQITVKNCTFVGGVRVYGLGVNGEATAVRDSSHNANHTAFAQASAPSHVTFENVTFQGVSTVPLYIAPGVTHTTVRQSRFTGQSSATAVYLDAESAYTQITNSNFNTTTPREVLAIDGSAHNTIANNYFSGLSNGGIYVYRNCGEGGTTRHQMPQYNSITDNTFYYKKYRGYTPTVWLSSRKGLRTYCGADSGYAFGSSADNGDFANHNTVMNNLWLNRTPDWLIRDWGSDNRVEANRREDR